MCVDVEGDGYRIGRPKVYKTSDGCEMYYTRDLVPKEYIIGYATSRNGTDWIKMAKRQDCKSLGMNGILRWLTFIRD